MWQMVSEVLTQNCNVHTGVIFSAVIEEEKFATSKHANENDAQCVHCPP